MIILFCELIYLN